MIDSSVICSVVPPLQPIISETVKRLFSIDPFIVSWEVDTGIHILYTHPQEVGADRIVNAVAAFERYRHAAIIVDFGTATTFDVISAKGEYLGGTISPGIGISMEALFMYTAKLPKVEFKKPEDVIGKNTIQSIQSGTYYGYIGLVEGLIRRIREKLPDPVKVIATGGLASLVFRDCKMIDEVDDNLTLHGLRIVFERMIHAHKT
jgi:type III pantothenate kinase